MMKKMFIILFVVSISTVFAKSYYYPGITSKSGGLKTFQPGKSFNPAYQYRSTYKYGVQDLSKPNFARYGYTKSFYLNGQYKYFGPGYMSYSEREKLKAIERRYSPRIKILENKLNMDNSIITSEIYQMYPNYIEIENAIDSKFRTEIELKMIETMREIDIKRLLE